MSRSVVPDKPSRFLARRYLASIKVTASPDSFVVLREEIGSLQMGEEYGNSTGHVAHVLIFVVAGVAIGLVEDESQHARMELPQNVHGAVDSFACRPGV